MLEIELEIERLSRARQALWFFYDGQPVSGEVLGLGTRLADAFEAKRHKRASAGTPEMRTRAIKRARIEDEIERLASR